MSWQATPPNLYFSKNAASDSRLGDLAKGLMKIPPQFSAADWVVLGAPDDEGILLNSGRGGAQLAPLRIRNYFYRMTPDPRLDFNAKPVEIFDFGNLDATLPLAKKHEILRATVAEIYKKKGHWLTLGGGHDYGYGDVSGFLEIACQGPIKPLVVNFDAHLDVRPTDQGLHSGTPFRRCLQEFAGQFHFIEVGLQPQCNSRDHLQWAREQGAHCLFLEDLMNKNLTHEIFECLPPGDFQKDLPVFISLDIDCIRSSEAPGCSAGYAQGLAAQDVIQSIRKIKKETALAGLGIYEVSPTLDVDDRTSKLAALIMHQLIFA